MNEQVKAALDELSPIQREAVMWAEGTVLLLAGPGSGKTRVLTTRIARLLDESPDRRFKVLALTFTTKAAAEMRERVERLVPGLVDERTYIGTFHAFCTVILRQHGSHIGVNPDFAIVDRKEERVELLRDALQAAIDKGNAFSLDDVRWLDTIDEFKSRLLVPEKAASRVRDQHFPEVYHLYEEALRAENATDFNGLILEACRLLAKMPAVANRYRQSYPYWMIDEFQDTSPAQYWLLHYLSGGEFKNVMVVADDDQIIYQWAGASYRQIEKFRADFKPELIQLVENHRCPPEIVGLANRLVAHNTQRTPDKKPITPAKSAPLDAVGYTLYESDVAEREAICAEIVESGPAAWGKIAIIGRTRALLQPMLACLRDASVKANLVQRRDSFVSPQFVWLQACLDQSLRPLNKRVFANLVNAANRFLGLELDSALLVAEAEAAGQSYFEYWGTVVGAQDLAVTQTMGLLVGRLANTRGEWKKIVDEAIELLVKTAPEIEGAISDVAEDQTVWAASTREIRSEYGRDYELSDFLQGIALRPKEPPRDPLTVTLLTVHGAKGLEFETVYVIGLAEREMPSWQSCDKGDASLEMEEERRNCFVAITRTQERLRMSSARNYRGYSRRESRFLVEMFPEGRTPR
jgi:DNA helicase-2/ATP-dependent DNA helicase PcrA